MKESGYKIAIKKLQTHFNDNNYAQDLLTEAILLNNCDHFNLIKIEGVCFKNNKIDSIIMEYMNSGDLLTYLRESKVNTLFQAIHIATQISLGCDYLESNKMIHRDLAARNCLLNINENNNLTVKIGDFGLAKELTSTDDYYRLLQTTNKCLPIRWMAPESITFGKYSTKSDVW